MLLMTTACALAGIFAAGCGSASPALPGADMDYVLEYSCCVMDESVTVWHPGQQITLGCLAEAR